MILILMGVQKFPFDRLLKAVDELIACKAITEEVFAQTGSCRYIPKHFSGKAYMTKEELHAYMERADLVITHGGTASIMEAVKMRKRVVAVPRQKRYHEHVDDHQKEVIRELAQAQIIEAAMEPEELRAALENARTKKFQPYKSGREAVLNELRRIIEELP